MTHPYRLGIDQLAIGTLLPQGLIWVITPSLGFICGYPLISTADCTGDENG